MSKPKAKVVEMPPVEELTGEEEMERIFPPGRPGHRAGGVDGGLVNGDRRIFRWCRS
jgi:hypothetical protein